MDEATVAPVADEESSTETLAEVSALDVTDVDVPSSPLAQATPTTANAVTTEVNTPSIF